jgi:hypothetical protein
MIRDVARWVRELSLEVVFRVAFRLALFVAGVRACRGR